MTKWEPGQYCHYCNNDGVVNCYCGGDQCYCENHGERDCPRCYGMSAECLPDDLDDDYGLPNDQ